MTETILITGGKGFLGRHLRQELEKCNLNVNIITFSSKEYDLTRHDQTLMLFERFRPDTVIHLAAMAGGIGFNKKHPADVIQINSAINYNIFEAVSKHKPEYFYGAGSVCFTEDCFIEIKKNHFKNINDIKENDFIASNNGYTKVKKIYKREYSGDVVTIQAYGAEKLTVTPEHPFLVYRDNKEQWIAAKNIIKTDLLVYNTNKNTNKKLVNVKIAENINENNYRTKNLPNKKRHIPKKIKINDDLAYLCGWYVAEGYSSENAITLYFGDHENDKIFSLQRIIEKNFKIKTTLKRCPPTQKGYRLDFYSKQIAHFFRSLFYNNKEKHTAHYKKIPDFILKSPLHIQLSFLKGYIEGDGHFATGKYVDKNAINSVILTSVSRLLIYQIRKILLQINIVGSIKSHAKKGKSKICGRTVNINDSWILKFTGINIEKIVKAMFIDKINKLKNQYDQGIIAKKILNNRHYSPIYKIYYENVKNIYVYNLHTENETYTANNFIVHNCSYPLNCPTPFKEDNLWDGFPEKTNSGYGQCKRTLLLQQQAFREQYGLRGAHFLIVNLFGPHDNFDLESSHVIGALIHKFVDAVRNNKKTVECWGTGQAYREFFYVEDCARAFAMAAVTKLDTELPINLGTGKTISIYNLAYLISKLTGFTGEIVFTGDVSDGQPKRQLDVSRAKELLGFTANIDLENGLKRTIEWYKENI